MLKEKTIINIREDKGLINFILTTDSEKEKNNAFTKLLNKYRYSVLNNLRRMVKQEDIAEDLLFEAFQKAYEKMDTYNNKQAFSTWLFRISHNHAIDYLRTQRNMIESLDDDQHNGKNLETYKKQIKTECKTAEEIIITNEIYKKLHLCISKLRSEQLKTVIELRYFKDFAYDEIATELDIPLGSVKILIHRAKKELRKLHEKTF